MAFNLHQAVHDALEPRETREDVISYFQEKYPKSRTNKKGQIIEEWRSKLSDALTPFATDKNGKPLKKASIMRRFQGGRGSGEVTPKVAGEYRDLGAMLPPLPPENGFHITGTACVSYSDGCEERDIDITIEGDEAKAFMESPSMQAVVNLYNEEDYSEEEPTASPCDGGDCVESLSVEAY